MGWPEVVCPTEYIFEAALELGVDLGIECVPAVGAGAGFSPAADWGQMGPCLLTAWRPDGLPAALYGLLGLP